MAGVKLPVGTIRGLDLRKGEQLTNESAAANPNQKISVLIDGDQSIVESCAILKYLGEK
jgi:GST-like protein